MAHILLWVGVAITPSILAVLFLAWKARGPDRAAGEKGRVRDPPTRRGTSLR
jgi:hypothetical protein